MKVNFYLFLYLIFSSSCIAQCPVNIFGFGTQAEVDNFINIYPNCENAYVFVFAGNDITDLTPLSYIDRIQHIQINDSDNITSLMAFDNTEVFSSLYIKDSDGLLNLDGIHLSDFQKYSWLHLENNSILENIDALDDLNLGIETVTIIDNPNLSECSVSRVCQSLGLAGAIVSIKNNAQGCNSQIEVEMACEIMGLNDFELDKNIILIPNPTSDIIQYVNSPDISIEKVKIYNQLGQLIKVTSENFIDISNLVNGIYFFEFSNNSVSVIKQVIKQ